MSAQEIIAELPKLKAEELRMVKEKLAELEADAGQDRLPAEDPFLRAVEGTARSRPNWPEDYALNHGHYVSGEPRK